MPVSLVYRKGFVQDGNAPLLLYGYGSYGIHKSFFSMSVLSLLDRGFVYAMAHTRGGSDMGVTGMKTGSSLKRRILLPTLTTVLNFL